MNEGINAGITKGGSLFSIRKEISKLAGKLDVQVHWNRLPNFSLLGNRPSDCFALCINSG